MQHQLERSFASKDVNEIIYIYNENISNVLNNHIPYEAIICDHQDPQRIDKKVKKAMQKKNHLFSSVKSNINSSSLLKKLQC